jgi:hypothetical protein
MLNGKLGDRIAHVRGMRQGDPPSPMLFLLVMEILNALIRKADDWLLFHSMDTCSISHRALLYVDDMVFFLSPDPGELQMMKNILMIFEGTSGLECNVHKCELAPIQCNDVHVLVALHTFPCWSMEFPVNYLGMQISPLSLPKAFQLPLLAKMTARMATCKGKLLHHSGRLAFVKTTLLAIPLYSATSLIFPVWLLKAI